MENHDKPSSGLTSEDVVKIYFEKILLLHFHARNPAENKKALSGKSVVLSQKYGTSAKTVRDIWGRRQYLFQIA